MPRTNRFFVPGHVWHITHRFHKDPDLGSDPSNDLMLSSGIATATL